MTAQFHLVATLLFAVAAGWFSWIALTLSAGRSQRSANASHLELERRTRLRDANSTFQRFEPLIDELTTVTSHFFDARQRDELAKALAVSAAIDRWNPLEYIACKQVEGILAGAVVGTICLLRVNILFAVAIGVAIAAFYVFNSLQAIKQQAASRTESVKRRLPFAVDLMALMLEAGAGFLESLKTVVRENLTHPLGEELGIVVAQVEMGRTRQQALVTFRDRFDDQDITDLVSAINKGEELGTPLSTIMRTQADQMRLKRSQWGEKAAAEAQVKMTFPSMLVMLACMLLILAPFVLPSLLKMF